MNYKKLKEIIADSHLTIPQLAKKIGMSKAGLYLAIDKERLSVEMLEKISEALNMPMLKLMELLDYLTDELIMPKEPRNLFEELQIENERLKEENVLLKNLIADKNELLAYYRARAKFFELYFDKYNSFYFELSKDYDPAKIGSNEFNEALDSKLFSDPELIELLKVRDKITKNRGLKDTER